jgi:calcium/proton exchanger cax
MGIISEKISQYGANSLIVITWIASLIAIIMHFSGNIQPTVQFVLALIGMINMARMVGDATEALSEKMGDMIGGMMSAACGNIPELIFSLIALFNGSYSLLLATLMGSVVSNLLLVFGTSIMVGSYKNNWRQSYKKGPIHDLAMLLLLGTAMMLPQRVTFLEQRVVILILLLSHFAFYYWL